MSAEKKDHTFNFVFSYDELKNDFTLEENPSTNELIKCSFCGKLKSKDEFFVCENGINLCTTCYKNKDYC